MSEVSSSYSLDLQLGKFKQKLDILFEVWKNVHQVIQPFFNWPSVIDLNITELLWEQKSEKSLAGKKVSSQGWNGFVLIQSCSSKTQEQLNRCTNALQES